MSNRAIEPEAGRGETVVMSQEKPSFQVALEVTAKTIRLLVSEPAGEILKAEFRTYPNHPRALLWILEGLALWSGERLYVAIHAEHPVDHSLGLGTFGGDEWPEANALIEFVFIETDGRRRRKLSGVGDFRRLRRVDSYGPLAR
jgi:hypothetical protein